MDSDKSGTNLFIVLLVVVIGIYASGISQPTTATGVSPTVTVTTTVTSAVDNSTIQSYVLSFVGQEAIAHAAAIFATLGAAFTFAAGFRKNPGNIALYVFILSFLFGTALYVILRLIFYGLLSALVLQNPPIGIAVPSAWCNETSQLSKYWCQVTHLESSSTSVPDGYLRQLLQFIPALSISWLIGGILSMFLTAHMLDVADDRQKPPKKNKFRGVFKDMRCLCRLPFFWASCALVVWIVLVAKSFFLPAETIEGISLVFALVPTGVFSYIYSRQNKT
jgi:hypothetical protein